MAVTPESPAFPHAEPHVGQGATANADYDADAYQHGEMAIHEQAATWSLFQKLAAWGALLSVAGALFSLLILAPNGGFLGALIPTVALTAVGGFLLTRRPKGH